MNRKQARLALTALVVLSLLVAPISARPKRKRETPEDLVRFFISKEEGVGYIDLKRNRAAMRLVAMGDSALPAVEKALTQLEREGESSQVEPGAYWLLYAYARLKGRAGYDRLKGMLLSPQLQTLHYLVEEAIAVSLDLTSFRSSSDDVRVFEKWPNNLPQDALNEFLGAWISGDRKAMESSMSPWTKPGMARLLETQPWEKLRQELLRESPEPVVLFGFRLSPPDLGRPPFTALYAGQPSPDRVIPSEGNVDLFTGNHYCARFRFRFVDLGNQHFSVESEDIRALLQQLGKCLSRPTAEHTPKR